MGREPAIIDSLERFFFFVVGHCVESCSFCDYIVKLSHIILQNELLIRIVEKANLAAQISNLNFE